MSKALKYALITFGALVLLVIAAGVVVTLVVDPNDYKPEIAKLVKDKTGRTLVFDGDLSLSLFPWLGVATGGLSLSNAPGFGDEPFVSLKRAEVGIKVMPLISGEIRLGRVLLDSLSLNLAVNEKGVSNWDDLVEKGEEQAAPKPEPEAGDKGGGLDLNTLLVKGVDIHKANVVYDDRKAGKRYEVRDFNLSTGSLSLGSPFTLKLSLTALSSDPDIEAAIKLAGRIHPDVAAKRVKVESLDLVAKATGKVLPMETLDLDLDVAEVFLDLAGNDYSVDNLVLVLESTGGDLPVEALKTRLLADGIGGNIAGQVHGVGGLEVGVDARGGKLPGEALQAHGSAPWIGVDLGKGNATIQHFALSAYDAEMVLDAEARDIMKGPKATGRLTLSEVDPKHLMAQLGLEPLETTDPEALTSLAAVLDFSYAPDAAKLSNATITLDQTHIEAWADVASMNATPAYAFAVDVDALNVDRYLPPAGEEEEPEEEEEKAEPEEKEKKAGLPVEELRKLDLDGRLAVGELTVKKVEATDVEVKVLAKNGVLTVKPFRLNMYDGAVVVNSRVDASDKTPKSALDANVAGLETGPLLMALAGKEWIAGKLNLTADLDTAGAEPEAMQKNLNGKAAFKILDGEVKGLDLLGQVSNALAKAKGGGQGLSREKRTGFADMHGSVKIKQGVASTGDLTLESPLLAVKGRGDVDIPKKNIDFVLETEVKTGAQKLLGKQTGALLNLSIPIYVKGSLDDPSIGPDMTEFVLILARKSVGAVGGVLGGAVGTVEDVGRAVFGGKDKKAKDSDAGEQQKKKPETPGELLKNLDKLF